MLGIHLVVAYSRLIDARHTKWQPPTSCNFRRGEPKRACIEMGLMPVIGQVLDTAG